MRVTDIPEISRLSIPEKILFVEDLWDGISTDESNIPIPQNHIRELDRRWKKYQKTPGKLLSLDDLRERIEARK